MTALRTLALAAFALFGLAIAVPAGSSTTGNCGPVVDIRDPGLRASFARFDANQSLSAAKVCAFYLNGDLSAGR
jgi:hypothetical protein